MHCLEHYCADVAACLKILIQDPVLRRRIKHAANIPQLDKITATHLAVIDTRSLLDENNCR